MNLFGTTRTHVRRNHALIAPDGHVAQALPGWTGGSVVTLISPQLGARFVHYLVTLEEGGQSAPPLPGVERFVYVVTDQPPEGGPADAPAGARYVRRQAVSLGPKALGLRVVREGLTADDLVVVTGLQALRPGSAVMTEPADLTPDESSDLPTDYQPWPKERWLSADGPAADARG